MRSTIAAIALAGAASAAPFKFPLPNGFPDVKPGTPPFFQIEQQAHGTLPNGPLPAKISAQSAGDFQVVAENELFEVAYFTSLLSNITQGVKGYEIADSKKKAAIVSALSAVQAQEELHAIGANAILTNSGNTAIKPCEYQFGVSNLQDAFNLATTFTDVVLGALQEVQADFAADGDSALIPLVGSIIGQEGEQVGYYRAQNDKIPSALPFLTRSSGVFAWSALNQNFIVPGSCPNPPQVPVLDTLILATPAPLSPADQKLTFVFDNKSKCPHPESLSLVYINQQNQPIVVKPTIVKTEGQTITYEADFPYAKNLLNSLTLAALTKSAGPFADVPSVAKDAVAGPGLIEVQ